MGKCQVDKTQYDCIYAIAKSMYIKNCTDMTSRKKLSYVKMITVYTSLPIVFINA